MTKVLTEV